MNLSTGEVALLIVVGVVVVGGAVYLIRWGVLGPPKFGGGKQ